MNYKKFSYQKRKKAKTILKQQVFKHTQMQLIAGMKQLLPHTH